ncbi:cation:proton antiporter [Bacillus sp. KH172YL63]|uniref:cation:proton antiporter n=1 Tax=Bacillus sp. KH172YL63 TaxID=2709784 RepID=UPI0013E50C50|nr:sodium:proton antiporter [Bacillus sp. KH172YL63]BCB02347.1 sodium:proton antiporter [Bacillus sp. KH172YL63]
MKFSKILREEYIHKDDYERMEVWRIEPVHLLFLLVIGYSVFTIDKKKKSFPVPVILLLIGIGLSFAPAFSGITLTKETIFEWFLPALLFISAYQFPTKALKKHAGIITFLSTIGIILTTLLMSLLFYYGLHPWLPISFTEALLISTILTPTDPVSVVSILKESSNRQDIADVVEGESMINDGTSIVLFTVVAGIYFGGERFSVSSFLGEFLLVSLGGIAAGVLLGWLASKAIHFTSDSRYQIMLSIILAYGTFYIGEELGVSGVLATVSAGIMLSYEYGKTKKENHFRKDLDGFWTVIEPTILTLLFLLIGIQTTRYLSFSLTGWILLLFVLSLFVRYVIIIGVVKMKRTWRKTYGWKEVFILTWSGIKGTMSVALLLGLDKQGPFLLHSLTFGVILLSLVIQSVGIYPLSTLFLKGEEKGKDF